MLRQMPAHKAIAVAAVLLLHVLLIWALLSAKIAVVAPAVFRELPITLWLQTSIKPAPLAPEKKKPEKEKQGPPIRERAIGAPVPEASHSPPASDYNGLRAFGRYLNNCSNAAYERLSSRELAHCLGNQWDKGDNAPLTLGIEPPSIWKDQMDKRKQPIKPFEHECAPGGLNSNLGLPCYN